MNTGDANYIKQLNRRILIEEIIKSRSLSRSDLARITGLNKATVSAQVSELIAEKIVIEKKEGESVTRGRKPILLELNANGAFSIGIDIVEDYINIIFMDLKGEAFHSVRVALEDADLECAVDQLIETVTPLIKKFAKNYQPNGLAGICVGIHGIVNAKEEIIFTPKQRWSNINIKDRLEAALQTTVYVDNNANLSVFAEQVFDEAIPDLFCITLYSGIGLGIMNENKIYRGYQGFAGEIGHMVVESKGLPCSCGNTGCWELYASERALMNALEKDRPAASEQEILDALHDGEGAAQIIDSYLDYLAVGINNIINIFNPEKIILNGTIINGNSPFITEIEHKLKSKINNYRDIRASRLGEYSCALGGAAFVIKNFFDVNKIDYTGYEYFLSIYDV
ncbi:ROK family transcriptional regulator [Oceanobacillus arenosus]|uniref:ROK family transcriptional regulator n=1 Tax=Oceanobacillus arenosus TaxID=1229153 RepID=A0A3D8Q202_9BACI|nr:ROK family transcriptional regulator [Oceanobacillus arenosus]RDW21877.1 ROK family transcriptional regulator [Oceanobacillus arenosus]